MSGLRRIQHGQGHRYELDGKPVPGVTTILSKGFPKPALINWAAEETAKYAVDHWDELAEIGPGSRFNLINRSRFTRQKEAALRGTDVHALARRILDGHDVQVPDELAGHVDAFLAFEQEWAVDEILVETVIGNRALGYAGTLDLIARLADGHTWLLDYKTNLKGIYTEAALQLAGYRYAEFYEDPDGLEQQMPSVDRCGIIWLRADGYSLIPVKADLDAFQILGCCLQVKQFTDLPREFWIHDELTAPEPEEAAA